MYRPNLNRRCLFLWRWQSACRLQPRRGRVGLIQTGRVHCLPRREHLNPRNIPSVPRGSLRARHCCGPPSRSTGGNVGTSPSLWTPRTCSNLYVTDLTNRHVSWYIHVTCLWADFGGDGGDDVTAGRLPSVSTFVGVASLDILEKMSEYFPT